MSTEVLFWLCVALAGVTMSALFSGMETGAYCVNRLRLAVRAGGSRPEASAVLLRRELQHPERVLATLLIGNNIANYLGSLGITALLARAGHSDWTIVVFNALILTPVLFVFGETLPKELFRAEADRLAPGTAVILRGARWAATATLALPLIRGFMFVLGRLVGTESRALGARARVAALLKEGAGHGVLSESQATLVDRALLLRSTALRDEMAPWSRVVRVGADWGRAQVENALRRDAYTRVPVVDRRGRVIGRLETLDVWANPEATVTSLLKPVTKLPPGMTVIDALIALRRQEQRMAVIEEDGRPVGLVTLKDLVEPLTGEIFAW